MPTPLATICLSLIISLLTLLSSPASAAGLDLSKALVIGNGPKTVIEFTDPDCPFCRKAATYFANRKDVTKYVFFSPLEKHPDARRKIQYILSQSNRTKAYYEVMTGKLDGVDVRRLPTTPQGVKLQLLQHEIAKKAGIDATPTFMLSGRIIEGFDLVKIEGLLGK